MGLKHPIEEGVEQYGARAIGNALGISEDAVKRAYDRGTLPGLCFERGVYVKSLEQLSWALENNRRLDGRKHATKVKESKPKRSYDVTRPSWNEVKQEWLWRLENGDVDYNDLRNYIGATPSKEFIEQPHIEWCAACGYILEMPDESPIDCPYPLWSKKHKDYVDG